MGIFRKTTEYGRKIQAYHTMLDEICNLTGIHKRDLMLEIIHDYLIAHHVVLAGNAFYEVSKKKIDPYDDIDQFAIEYARLHKRYMDKYGSKKALRVTLNNNRNIQRIIPNEHDREDV